MKRLKHYFLLSVSRSQFAKILNTNENFCTKINSIFLSFQQILKYKQLSIVVTYLDRKAFDSIIIHFY